ncbi:SBBP repeat-containing protein [Emticicia sp.]|uniref:SBBP repeat-containing protein n=1 Tax=Emticicia sp. TaxID=1930953 RepID=UPI0037522105
MKYVLIIQLLLFCQIVNAQSTLITSGGQGTVQVPKLSYDQITAIPNPKAGMVAFDSTFRCLRYYTGSKWLCTSQSESNNSTNPVGFAWRKGGSYDYDHSYSLLTDANNNVYISGIITYVGCFIAKFSSNGTLIWEKYIGGYNSSNATIKIDINFNVYVVYNTSSSLGCKTIWIEKYNSIGDLIWSNRNSDCNYNFGYDIFLDTNNNVYLAGTISGSLTFGSTTINSTVNNETFVAKFSNSGSFMWVKTMRYSNVIISNNGDCVFAGYFSGSTSIETNNFNSFGNEDILIGKYDTNGSLIWVKQAGGSGIDKANDLKVDASGNVYVTGSFSTSSNFSGNTINSIGLEDFFVVKYQANGTLSWIKQGGGTGIDKGLKMELNPVNDPIVLGECNSNPTSFSSSAIFPSQTPSSFLIRYFQYTGDLSWVKIVENAINFKINSSGNIYTWSKSIGYIPGGGVPNYTFIFSKYSGDGTLMYTQRQGGNAKTMTFGNNNDFFFTGIFQGTVQMGASTLTDIGGQDIFVSHWME